MKNIILIIVLLFTCSIFGKDKPVTKKRLEKTGETCRIYKSKNYKVKKALTFVISNKKYYV